jgi:two-component sensor histidine kinase
MKILIADDDIASRKILAAILEKNGHEPVLFSNGNDAWEALTSPGAPNIVILDWLMPGIDGEELCRKTRTLKNDIPPYIIMLTIKGEKGDIIRGLEAGANDYLSKPYDPGELRARVEVGKRMIELETDRLARINTLELNEKKISTLLAEKDILLYEVHHRIKNNMNMIVNILTMHTDQLGESIAATILNNAVSRIKSMGILYDRLYRSENLSSLSIREYLVALINDITGIFPDRYRVDLDIDIEDVAIDVHKLSCIGMIVNELVFNAMKYAFKGKECGRISIDAFRTKTGMIIAIEDDGIGMPPIDTTTAPESFGLKLVFGLTEQINGRFTQERCEGTRFVLEFPINGS